MDTGQTKQIIEQLRKMADTMETNTAALAAIAKTTVEAVDLFKAHIARAEHARKNQAEMEKSFEKWARQMMGSTEADQITNGD